jgi:hypothetical protein
LREERLTEENTVKVEGRDREKRERNGGGREAPTIALHPGFFRVFAVFLLVLAEISFEEGAVRQLDGLVVAQVSEARVAPMISVVRVSVVECISSYSLPSTTTVAVINRRLEFKTDFTTDQTGVLVKSAHLYSLLGMCDSQFVLVVELPLQTLR